MIIVSITTIPKRLNYLDRVLPILLNQTLKYDKLVINLDNNLTSNEYEAYEKLAERDPRIEVYKDCDPKWRSANKLLPTIQRYTDAVVITMDDDLEYPLTCCEELYNKWKDNKDCIICQEINPTIYRDGKLEYLNTLDIKLMQREFGKYLTHSCLFPPHVFDGTEVFDFDKMMKLTNGTHDELWFWEQTTLKGVQVIGLDYTMSYGIDSTIQHKEGEYTLTDTNKIPENIDEYNRKFNEEYGYRIGRILSAKPIEFFVTRENLQAHVGSLWQIKQLYGGFPNIVFWVDSSMLKSHVWYLSTRLQMNGFNDAQIKIRRRLNFTFGVFTHNEGRKYIETCVEHIRSAMKDGDELLLVDDFSTDEETCKYLDEIKSKVRIIKHHLNGDFATHKNYLLDNAKKDWILLFDADEYMEVSTIEALRKIASVNNDKIDSYYIPHLNRIIGLDMDYVSKMHWTAPIVYGEPAINYPDYHIRMFKNVPYIRYKNKIHEIPIGYKSTGTLPMYKGFEFSHIKTQERQVKQNLLYNQIDEEYYRKQNIELK